MGGSEKKREEEKEGRGRRGTHPPRPLEVDLIHFLRATCRSALHFSQKYSVAPKER